MSIKRIKQLAHKTHALLLLTSLFACIGTSGLYPIHAKSNPSPIQEAKETNLTHSLRGHKFTSNQFTSLLINQFHEYSDENLSHDTYNKFVSIFKPHSDVTMRYGEIYKVPKKIFDNTGKLLSKQRNNGDSDSLGTKIVLHMGSNTSRYDFSMIKNDNPDNTSPVQQDIKYNITNQYFTIFEANTNNSNVTSHTLKAVRYHIHSINNNEMTFYPQEFQYINNKVYKIPTKQRKNYPLKLTILPNHKTTHNTILPTT